ncbi:hypothetical protein A0O32_1813 [Anoxybacillus flavithermus]|nr:hypothetical protein A0O32_1813 [Anoxybacillus flavithermus]
MYFVCAKRTILIIFMRKAMKQRWLTYVVDLHIKNRIIKKKRLFLFMT